MASTWCVIHAVGSKTNMQLYTATSHLVLAPGELEKHNAVFDSGPLVPSC